MCRPSNIDGRCEIRLLYLLKILILYIAVCELRRGFALQCMLSLLLVLAMGRHGFPGIFHVKVWHAAAFSCNGSARGICADAYIYSIYIYVCHASGPAKDPFKCATRKRRSGQ